MTVFFVVVTNLDKCTPTKYFYKKLFHKSKLILLTQIFHSSHLFDRIRILPVPMGVNLL